jgi:ADP-dependent NAD(P)H-hydrate dehydratase / NAD(P)H-hydrate epimerase
MKLVTADQMRSLEEKAFAAGTTAAALMENAGRAVAIGVRDRLGDARAQRILVLVGPGNNGGDGLVAARYLHDFGAEVQVALLAPRSDDDANFTEVRSRGIEVLEGAANADVRDGVEHADAIIDSVLGTGRQRPLDGDLAALFYHLARRRGPLFAVDLPTGVDADSGALDPGAARADVTLALGFSKIGLHVLPGAVNAGQVQVLDIGLDPAFAENIQTELLTRDWARSALPKRPLESNKGTFGRVMVVAGSTNYSGAAALSCLGALRCGAGLVTLASVANVRASAGAFLPEVTHLQLPDAGGVLEPAAGDAVARDLAGYDALLIGPGLGLAPETQSMVRGLLGSAAVEPLPVVVDADALNALAHVRGWHEHLTCRAVLTPHPGELARLAGTTVPEVQASRLKTAREGAAKWNQVVVLKGAHTIIAAPDGRALISPFANAALATAGTGDVLAGTIAGLLAQEVELVTAAGLGVYLHGAAAELFSTEYGSSGMLASELGAAIARAAAQLRRGD